MGLVVTYSSPTTPGGAGWSEDLSSAVRLGTIAGIVDEAELGAVGVSSLLFDDVDGTLGHSGDGIVGLKQLHMDETAAPPGNQRLWTGYIGQRHYKRGTDSLRLDVARKIDTDLVDINGFLSFRIFAPVAEDPTSSFVRPAETDLERVAALLAVDFLSDTLYDEGLVATTLPVDMDKCDYTGQKPLDVLNDCAQQSGRNFFPTYNEATGHYQLFYHFDYDPVFDSPLQISNVLADVDGVTTFAPEPDAELVRNPDRVISAVYMPFSGTGSPAYRTLPTTAYTYAWRDGAAPSANVKTLTKANARADRYLATNSTEDDRITCTLRGMPAQYVTGIKAGQRVKCKFSHMPLGVSGTWGGDFAWCRVLNRSVMANETTNVLYNMRLELSPLPLLSCSYVAPPEFGVSSVDILGATFDYDFLTYNGLHPAYSAVQTFNGVEYPFTAVAPQGVPNDYLASIAAGSPGGVFGFPAFDSPEAQSLVYTCTFDLGPLGSPAICAVGLYQGGGFDPNFSLRVSDDGTTWTSVTPLYPGVDSAINIFPLSSYVPHRYWQLYMTRSVPSGLTYVGEVDLHCFMLWAAV